ncbi:hypothetical protein SAML1593_11630 [Salmonella enterica]|nr:hypothetical protein SAML2017_10160 [Salmonella enterica]BCQ90214.1 hypothetical protein SAML1593_11630 [Salmonella enterica]BCQ94840.1 hypothetical protein SAML1960_11600 [Salmonella enterica]BCQ99580.1 hypothetical protein SAML2008_12890 [Salmonella enterica]
MDYIFPYHFAASSYYGSTTRWTYNRDGSLIELNVKATKKACTDDVVKQFINGNNKMPEHAF